MRIERYENLALKRHIEGKRDRREWVPCPRTLCEWITELGCEREDKKINIPKDYKR